MENCRNTLKKWRSTCFEGEVTMPKVNFWLVGAVCLLAGIVYGLVLAPMTHGVMIACNNGNSENYYDNEKEEEKE